MTGFLVDNTNRPIEESVLIVYSEEPKYPIIDSEGYLVVDGLERGTHEIYLFKNANIEELKTHDKAYHKAHADGSATFTTSPPDIIPLNDDGDKIVKFKPDFIKDIVMTFDPNGGVVDIESKTIYHTKTYGELPIPTRSGCTFGGWYHDDVKIEPSNTVSEEENFTVKAKWIGNQFELSFDALGGTTPNPISINYLEPYGELPLSTYTGYRFDGWYESISYDNKIESDTINTIIGDHTAYAKWTANTYTVSFNANGGTSVESIQVTYGHPYGDLPTSTKEGYTGKWCLDSQLTNCISSTTIVSTTSNHTLYAKWTARSSSLEFDPNGGTVSPTGKDVTYGQPYGELPTPTYYGYNFAGWYTEITGGTQITDSSIVDSTSGITLYAHWNPKTMTVDFAKNDGSNGYLPSVLTVTFGTAYGDSFASPEREGYDFLGWYTEATGGTKVEPLTIVTVENDHTLYAHWKIKQYEFRMTKDVGVDTIYYKPNTASEYLSISTDFSVPYDYSSVINYYATPAAGYIINTCNFDNPCSGTIAATYPGLVFNPIGTKITASMISFDNSNSNLNYNNEECADLQCALDALYQKFN